ncbi:conserved hypothetical protein [Ricinus communis]|uniref:Uncharacterized protein n=1 Tax=Ricinus communis TaxID=3988 RepID=B9S9R4_RICCO|nr:conserved hypothetical protein [Ricinus communis]
MLIVPLDSGIGDIEAEAASLVSPRAWCYLVLLGSSYLENWALVSLIGYHNRSEVHGCVDKIFTGSLCLKDESNELTMQCLMQHYHKIKGLEGVMKVVPMVESYLHSNEVFVDYNEPQLESKWLS